MQETWVWSLGLEDPPEKEMAMHVSILAWEIPWTEEPGRAAVHGEARKVGCNLVTKHNSNNNIHYRTGKKSLQEPVLR